MTQVQCYAIPEDLNDPFLTKWVKPDEHNPIAIAEKGVNASAFRDPTTAWKDKNGHWKILVGSKRKHRGMAYLFRSRDFKKWVRSKHPIHSAAKTGMWECPDFYPVLLKGKEGLDTSIEGDHVKHVLKNSLDLTRYEYYTLGTYFSDEDKYVPSNTSEDGWGGLRYDYGNFYASKSFFDQ
ncbi:beta-fructofuranosidase insoluble isoenzyme 1-like, partial [Trifolium medium]|nr:beta-fructofuranosidase insoluble isoenzyme 1-like [Trifolium medium]